MTDLALDEVAERLMRMDPARPGVGRLAQELVAAVGGMAIEPASGDVVPWYTHRRRMIPRVLT